MANLDAPRGFVPIGHLTGGEIRARSYLLDEDTDTIYKGDAMAMGLNGKVTRAAATELLVGVAAEYCATAEGKSIMIYDDPNMLFEVQGYTGITFAINNVGEQADIVATAGSDTTYLSLEELNDSSLAKPAQFLIIGKVGKADNAWGEHVKLIVKPYYHFASFNPTS
jgi:hypothetical protein